MAIDMEDLEPSTPQATIPDLEKMSLEELKEYVAGLQREIDRANAMISAKEDHRNSADQLFGR